MPFLFLTGYTNPAVGEQRFTSEGILGLAHSNRNDGFVSYPFILNKLGLAPTNGFTLKRNEKGAKSWLSIGQFDDKVHKQNFTLKTIEGFPKPVWTFEAYDVRIGDFIFTSEKHTTTVVSNNYPYILLQSKDEMAGMYFIGNFSAQIDDV